MPRVSGGGGGRGRALIDGDGCVIGRVRVRAGRGQRVGVGRPLRRLGRLNRPGQALAGDLQQVGGDLFLVGSGPGVDRSRTLAGDP